MKAMTIAALRKVIKRMHYPLEVMLTCVRWYAAYPLSLRHIEEMMAERGVAWRSITPTCIAGRPRSCLCSPQCFAGANIRWA